MRRPYFSLPGVSKGISSGHGQNSYRGLVKILKSAGGARNFSRCDSLLLGNQCGAHTFPYLECRKASPRATDKTVIAAWLKFSSRRVGRETFRAAIRCCWAINAAPILFLTWSVERHLLGPRTKQLSRPG